MCVFQERLLLIYSPTNFVSFAILICSSLYSISVNELYLLALLNWIKWVLSKLKNSKLDLNHLFSYAKTILRSLCNWLLLGLVIKALVSSANKIGRALCLTALGWGFKTWMEGVQAAMTTRNLETDQWRNREEWRLVSRRRRKLL